MIPWSIHPSALAHINHNVSGARSNLLATENKGRQASERTDEESLCRMCAERVDKVMERIIALAIIIIHPVRSPRAAAE